MATGQLHRVLKHLQATGLLADHAGLSDAQLLDRYLVQRDEAAFEALVRRHGPMVLGVCRRILRNGHDAEDAFQATFLVLVRKAASIRPRGLVGNWLYGVACRTAAKARALGAKRRAKELAMPTQEARDLDTSSELQALLDRELGRLPDKYRAPLVLCDLEGQTRKEAARRLGWPEGTVATRIAQARALLARRLARHRAPLSAAALSAALSQRAASATLPAPLLVSTLKAATLFAAGQAGVAASAAALAQGVLKSMLITKLRIATAVLFMAGVIGLTVGANADQAPAAQPADPAPTVKKTPALPPLTTKRPPADALPAGASPRPALISLDDKGLLVVRSRTFFFQPVTTVTPTGDSFTSYRAVEQTTTNHFNLAKTKVFDTGGKPVSAKQVLKLLMKGELLALTASHEPVDALHLRLVKEDTLIFVLPMAESMGPANAGPAATQAWPQPPPPPLPPPPAPIRPPTTQPEPPANEPQVRVGRIIIAGNENTPDRLILDTVALHPGAVLTFNDLRAAEQSLAKLKRFKNARVAVINDGVNEYRDIRITVEERLDPSATELKKLEGVWQLESMSMDGKTGSPAGRREFVFKGNRVTFRGDEQDATMSIKLDLSRKPALMELTGPESDGDQVRRLIYEINGDTLRLGVRPGNDTRPPTGFSVSGSVLMTLKRTKASAN